MTLIKKFSEISKEDVNLVGGKAASLGEMTRFGIEIPPGFVITTENFQKLLDEDEIFKAFDNLDAEKVAVRSSAVAEDSLQSSWAGQLETYLNIPKENLIEKIKECWDSINSERALDYVSSLNMSENDLQVAVVVQKMVNSRSAGVIFTANPVTNNTNEIMIESVLGLGESLVQGSVTPDNFVIDKESGYIKGKDIAQDEQSIYDEDIEKLVELARKIEAHYGKPQDIEWAIDKENKIWILQSRPITTL